MVKGVFSIARRVTFETGLAFIHIPLHFVMFIVHIALVMFVAGDAAEHSKIRWCGVAIGAFIPFTGMFARINREKFCIMIFHAGRLPSRIEGVAFGTICRETAGCMVRVRCLLIVGLVARKTLGRDIVVIISGQVASAAIVDVVSFFEGEEGMVDPCPTP